MIEFGSATAANVKCAKCQAALGPTGTFSVIGAAWYHSWCAPAVARGTETEVLQKLYGDKSEQYVAERLAHEETRKRLAVSEDQRMVSAPQTDFGNVTMARARELWSEAAFGRALLTNSTEAEAVVIERLRSYSGPPGYSLIPNSGCDFTGEIRNVIQAISERCANAEKRAEEMERERDAAKAGLNSTWRDYTDQIRRERDEAQSSLMRVREALKPFADAWEVATAHESTKHLSLGQLGELAAHECSGVHYQRARSSLSPHPERENEDSGSRKIRG